MQGQKGRGRGFASMSPEKKREIASKGGKAAHALGTAHKWTSEEAQAAGRKGGSVLFWGLGSFDWQTRDDTLYSSRRNLSMLSV